MADKQYPIMKDVPLPSLGVRQREIKYPFHQMDVGDSFPLSDSEESDVRYMITIYRERHGMAKKFAVRQHRRGDRSSYRCWRTA